jgi:hypothetical protein
VAREGFEALMAGKDQVVAGMFKMKVQSDSPFALKVLDRALVLLGLLARVERAEVLPLAGLRVYFARVEPVLPRLQLSDHFQFLLAGSMSKGQGAGRRTAAGNLPAALHVHLQSATSGMSTPCALM